jgi:quercetin dioxygenase-like cupin family protein
MDRSDFLPARIRQLPEFEGPFDAYKLAAEGADVLFATYPAGTTIEPHQHNTENTGVIIRGELIMQKDGVESRYGPGDWYHILPGVVHEARFEQDTAEVEFWFQTTESTASTEPTESGSERTP